MNDEANASGDDVKDISNNNSNPPKNTQATSDGKSPVMDVSRPPRPYYNIGSSSSSGTESAESVAPASQSITVTEPDTNEEATAIAVSAEDNETTETVSEPTDTETSNTPESFDTVVEEPQQTEPDDAPAESDTTEEPTEQSDGASTETEAAQPEEPEEPIATDSSLEQTETSPVDTATDDHTPEGDSANAAASQFGSTEPNAFAQQQTVVSDEPTDSSTMHESSNDQPSVTPLAPPHTHGKSKLPLLLFLVSLVLIGAAVAAWYVFSHNSKKQGAAAKTVVTDIADLRVASLDGPIGNDALLPTAPPANFAMQIDFQAYEGLVGYDNQKIVPLLASSWTNPDNNTWVFKLKDNIKFQNGKTMTAQDVKSSLDTLMKDQDWLSYLQTISSVSADSPTQVTIKTTSPDSLLLNRLTYGFVFSQNADKTLSGTGAYTIDAANSKTEDKTKLIAFDGYHGGKPKTRVIDYTVYKSPEDVVKAMQAGNVDIAYMQKNDAQVQTLAQNNFSHYDYSNTGAYGLSLNMIKKGPLQNLQVRQALAYALDRSTFIAKSQTPRAATNYVVPQSVVGYDETAKFPDFSAATAKQTLTKAGYPNGVPLTLNYISGIQNDAPLVATILSQSGFNITAKAFPSPKEFVAANSAGNYDLFLARFDTDLGDGLDIFAGLLGSKTSAFPSYNNPDFDKMISDAEQAFQPSDHVQKVQAINRFVATNYLWMPLANSEASIYYPKSYNYTVDSVTGIGGTYLWKLGNVQTVASTTSTN